MHMLLYQPYPLLIFLILKTATGEDVLERHIIYMERKSEVILPFISVPGVPDAWVRLGKYLFSLFLYCFSNV